MRVGGSETHPLGCIKFCKKNKGNYTGILNEDEIPPQCPGFFENGGAYEKYRFPYPDSPYHSSGPKHSIPNFSLQADASIIYSDY